MSDKEIRSHQNLELRPNNEPIVDMRKLHCLIQRGSVGRSKVLSENATTRDVGGRIHFCRSKAGKEQESLLLFQKAR